MIPTDFNNDGINEVLFYHHNSKMNDYNQQEDVGGGVDWDYNATTTLLHTNQS